MESNKYVEYKSKEAQSNLRSLINSQNTSSAKKASYLSIEAKEDSLKAHKNLLNTLNKDDSRANNFSKKARADSLKASKQLKALL